MKKMEFVVDGISIFPTDVVKGNKKKEKMTLSSSSILSEKECRQILQKFRKLNKKGRGASRLEYLLNYYHKKNLELVSIQGSSGYSLKEVIGSDWDMDYSYIRLSAKSLPTWSGLFIFRKNQN